MEKIITKGGNENDNEKNKETERIVKNERDGKIMKDEKTKKNNNYNRIIENERARKIL